VHPYWRRNGEGLAPGLYVAVREPGGFNEDSEFRGPFRRTEEAQAALQKLAALLLRRRQGWRTREFVPIRPQDVAIPVYRN